MSNETRGRKTPEGYARLKERSLVKRKAKIENLDNIHAGLKAHVRDDKRININLTLFDIRQFSLDDTFGVYNQICVLYKNGSFESIPVGAQKTSIRSYLGIKFNRVTHWMPFPARNKNHLLAHCQAAKFVDLYE